MKDKDTKHLELAQEIAAPVWEMGEHDPKGFEKWIQAICFRLDLFEKEIREKLKEEEKAS